MQLWKKNDKVLVDEDLEDGELNLHFGERDDEKFLMKEEVVVEYLGSSVKLEDSVDKEVLAITTIQEAGRDEGIRQYTSP